MIIPLAIGAGILGYLLLMSDGKGVKLKPGDQLMVTLTMTPEPPKWQDIVQNPAPFVKALGDMYAQSPEQQARLVWASPSPAIGTFTMIIEALKPFTYTPKAAQMGAFTMTPTAVKKLAPEQKLAG